MRQTTTMLNDARSNDYLIIIIVLHNNTDAADLYNDSTGTL